MRKGDAARARTALETALKTDPQNLEATSSIIGLDLMRKRAPDAVPRIDRRAAQTPKSVPVLMLAARTHAAARDLAGAEKTLRQVLDIDSSRDRKRTRMNSSHTV